jgi:argininosuccinate synthase
VLAPVREWDLCTRELEMDYAAERGIPVPTTKDNPYSIDDNLWGRAIECGVLEDPWVEPPADIYTLTADSRGNTCDEPSTPRSASSRVSRSRSTASS